MYGFRNLVSNYETRRIRKRKTKKNLPIFIGIAGLALSSLAVDSFLSTRHVRSTRISDNSSQTLLSLEDRTNQSELDKLMNQVQTEVIIPHDTRKDYQYDNIIQKHSKINGLDFYLVKGLIYTESSFNPKAHGNDGEIGLMQLKITTAKIFDSSITEEDLEDPETNIRIGTRYLSKHNSRYQTADSCLVAYNCGPGVFKRLKNAFSHSKIRRYPGRVNKARQVYIKNGSFFKSS